MGKNLSWFASSSTKKFWIKGIDLSLNTCRMMRWHNWLSPFLLSTCRHIALDNPLGLTNPGKEDLGLPKFTITYALCIHMLIWINICWYVYKDILFQKDFLGMVYSFSFGRNGTKGFKSKLVSVLSNEVYYLTFFSWITNMHLLYTRSKYSPKFR